MKLKVGKKEYTLRFGYKAVAKSGITRKALAVETLASEDKTGELIEEIIELVAEMVLAGLQKTDKNFIVDYDDKKDVNVKLDRIYDILDDYSEEDDSMTIMELFEAMMTELFDGGFFEKKSQKEKEVLTQTDATVVPLDHRKR